MPFFQLLKTTAAKDKLNITPELMNKFRSLNNTLDTCCQLALRQLLSKKQLVLMTDAGFQAAGYAVLFGSDPNQKYTSTRKTHAPVSHTGQKHFYPSRINMSIYAKESLAIYLAPKEI